MTAPVVAAAIVAKEKRIVTAFRNAGATSPDRAARLDDLGIHRGIALRRLQRDAVLRLAAADRWYLDEPSWQAVRGIRRRLALVMLVLMAIALLAVVGIVTYH